MAWIKQSDLTGGRVLDALFEAARPFVDAALETAPLQPARVAVRLYAGSPILARVVLEDADGRERCFDSIGSGDTGDALAKALGDFTTRGLNTLPVATRQAIATALDSGQIVVRLDAVFADASAQLEVPGHRPVELFTLRAGDVH